MTSRSGQVRASGSTQGEEVLKEVSEENDKPLEIEGPEGPEPKRDLFRTPGFSRMRIDWRGDDQKIVYEIQSTVERRIVANFLDAYRIMHDIYELVRVPVVDGNGETVKDQHGFTVWQRTESGDYAEDWSLLTRREAQDILFRLTTRLFDWEQRAQDAWGEAMFARAQWEERFAIDYDGPMKGTIEDRTAKARMGSADERYFAIFQTLYSRKAEALVRSMNSITLRIRDIFSTL